MLESAHVVPQAISRINCSLEVWVYTKHLKEIGKGYEKVFYGDGCCGTDECAGIGERLEC